MKSGRLAQAGISRTYNPTQVSLPQGLVSIPLCFPKELKLREERLRQFISTATFSHSFVAFEILGTSERLIVQFSVPERDREILTSQLESHFPEIALLPGSAAWPSPFRQNDPMSTTVTDFGLARPWFLPLGARHSGTVDPLVSIDGGYRWSYQGPSHLSANRLPTHNCRLEGCCQRHVVRQARQDAVPRI
jgi:hypothetical protein